MPPRTVSEDFEQYSAERVTQPSVGGVIKYPTVEYTKGVRSTSMRAGGVGMQRGGRAMKSAGDRISNTGLKLSRSGAGAVVGVPLMAAGKVLRGVGSANQSVGKVVADSGRQMRNRGRGTKFMRPVVADKAETVKDRMAATRASVQILSVATPLWFTLQLPIAIFSLIAFGSAETAAAFLPEWLVEWIANDFLYLFLGAVFLIGFGTLIFMAITYALSGVSGFLGKGSHIKGPVFCLAVVLYMLPFTNLFPWFILWALAVWRYPK